MSRSVNRVILVGNAGSDPDVRETPSGSTVAHLSLATNRVFQHNGQEQRKTEWHRLTFWAGAAQTVEKWVRKGTRMYVEGRIEDESLIEEIMINGVLASYIPNELNPSFTANLNVMNQNNVTVTVTDQFGNPVHCVQVTNDGCSDHWDQTSYSEGLD